MFGSDVVALVDQARKAVGVDDRLLSPAELMGDALGLAEALSLIEAALAHRLHELDVRDTCERESGLTTRSWLTREAKVAKARAGRSLSLGRGLRHLPGIDDAVGDGRLTADHAAFLARKVTTRVADAVALLQDQIVDWAADRSFEIWARDVAALIELLDQDGAHDPDDDVPHNELTIAPTTDGVTFLSGQFAGADAALVRQTIEAKADELFHRAGRDRDETGGAIEVPPRSVLRAEALVELCRLANARDVGSSTAARADVTLLVRASPPLDDDHVVVEDECDAPDASHPPAGTAAAAAADADLEGVVAESDTDTDIDVHAAEHAAAAGADADGEDADAVDGAGEAVSEAAPGRVPGPPDRTERPGEPRHDGEPPGAGAIDDLLAARSQRSVVPVPMLAPLWPDVTDLAGVRLQDATTRALLCDPDLHALVVDGLGTPLDLGRSARFANDDQRRALRIRDGGCIFPGCDRPPGWCDAHHSEPYEAGGSTDLAVLALLCRRHHGISHRRGWLMHATDDGWFWWRAPNGQTFWSQRHGRRRQGPTPS